jgi:hypothetical protein
MNYVYDEHGPAVPGDDINKSIPRIMPTQSDADYATEVLAQLHEALKPVCAIMDEAAARCGFAVQWDSISPAPPFMKHELKGLRLVRPYYK